jgi:lysophospholipase L1-like esterase
MPVPTRKSPARLTRASPLRFALFALLPALVFFSGVELLLRATSGLWLPDAELGPAFVLERQGGLLDVQRRLAERAGSETARLLAGERMYRRDSALVWRLRPDLDLQASNWLRPPAWGPVPVYRIRTDRSGLRDLHSKAPHTGLRILCLGDSSTFGWGVEESETFARQTEAMLRASHPAANVQVVNAGIPGYSSHQGLRFLRDELLELEPDVLVVSFGFNDSRSAATTDREQAEQRATVLGRLDALVSPLYGYRLLQLALGSGSAASLASQHKTLRVPIDDYRANLLEMLRIARANEIEAIFAPVVMPAEYRDALREVAESEEVRLVDAMPTLVQSLQELTRGEAPAALAGAPFPIPDDWRDIRAILMSDPVHPTALGQFIIASELAKALIAAGSLAH